MSEEQFGNNGGTGNETEGLSVEAVLGAIENNPEMKQTLATQLLTPDTVSSYLDTEQGKSIISPRLDSFASKAIESWKSKHLDEIVTQRVNELNPAETEEQRQLRQVQAKLKEIEAEKDRLALQSVATAALTNVGLPSVFADYVIGDSPEATKHNVNSLDVEINTLLSQRMEEKVKGLAAQTAPANMDSGNGGQGNAQKSLSDMTPQEAVELKRTNPARYAALAAQL